mmetsp:Transcript_14441/g.39280  ORF Transcript_14441/g.39280 Transcript_14441/m.39280 type:complete len:492 (+) Transcript_14441:2-1477(+)
MGPPPTPGPHMASSMAPTESALRRRGHMARMPSAAPIDEDSSTATDTDVDAAACSDTELEPNSSTTHHSAIQAHSTGENKLTKLVKRLFFGTSLLFALIYILFLGHLTTLGVVLVLQILMFRELVNVRYRTRAVLEIPLFRTTQWGWFGTCMLYSYGASFSDERLLSLIRSPKLVRFLPYVQAISMGCYSFMLMVFVLTLKKGYYKYQMGQLAWTIAIIVVTVVQSNSFTQNIFHGLFWFLYPVGLVICNDSMAYFCGLALGKRITTRPFLSISPNKTWEGFFGGGVCTIIFAYFFPLLLVRFFHPTICPCESLFDAISDCETPPPFLPANLDAWGAGFSTAVARTADSFQRRVLGDTQPLLRIQMHGLVLGSFASLVAPFGGFFASGIKRAYKIKDFSAIIPGHGGVFDRIDCQLIMGLFTYTYYSTFVQNAGELTSEISIHIGERPRSVLIRRPVDMGLIALLVCVIQRLMPARPDVKLITRRSLAKSA